MRADRVEASWDTDKKKWLVRIQSGEEVIRRYCDGNRDIDDQKIRAAAQALVACSRLRFGSFRYARILAFGMWEDRDRDLRLEDSLAHGSQITGQEGDPLAPREWLATSEASGNL